jgi:hypothetical protein
MKNMKKITNIPVAKIILIVAVLATACSSLGGFTRGTAATAIEQDKRYNMPATMTTDIGWKLTNAQMRAWQISKDDTAEAAAIRAKEDFMLRHPQIIVAEHLGFITLHLENPELGPRQIGDQPTELWAQNLGIWRFKARAKITEKGKKLWENLKLPVNEESLPLAVRDSPEITGLSDEGQQMKKADFTCKWKPTELGKSFDPNSAAFRKLPENLQEALKKTQRNIFGGGSNNIMDFNTPRAGIAHFKKYDDGWRLEQLYFM